MLSRLSEIPAPAFALGPDREILCVTRPFEQTLGYAGAGLIGRSIDTLVADGAPPAAAYSGEGGAGQWRLVGGDGRLFSAASHSARLLSLSGEPLWLTLLTDLSAAADLSEEEPEGRHVPSDDLYRRLAEDNGDLILRLTLDTNIAYASRAARRVLGAAPGSLAERPYATLAPLVERAGIQAAFAALAAGATEHATICHRHRAADRRWIWLETQLRALRDPETGAPTDFVATVRDISDRKRSLTQLENANRRLETLAGEDWLTGLGNRRFFEDMWRREKKRAARERKSLGLLILDIDCFKPFNDLYGHPAGDEALRAVAGAIRGSVFRPSDYAIRLGGEEFVVLAPGLDESGARIVAERVRAAVEALAIPHSASPYGRVTVSVGVACEPGDLKNGEGAPLLERADKALYVAKRAGRNRVEIAGPEIAPAAARVS